MAWASVQKGKISFTEGGGLKLASCAEGRGFNRQIYDALKSGIEGFVCGIVKRLEPPISYDLDDAHAGLNDDT